MQSGVDVESLRRRIFELNDKVLGRMVQVVVSVVVAFIALAVGTTVPGLPQAMAYAGVAAAGAATMVMFYCLYQGWRALREMKGLYKVIQAGPDPQAAWWMTGIPPDWKADDITAAHVRELAAGFARAQAQLTAITMRFHTLRTMAKWGLWSAVAVVALHVVAVDAPMGSMVGRGALWASLCLGCGCVAVLARLSRRVSTGDAGRPAAGTAAHGTTSEP